MKKIIMLMALTCLFIMRVQQSTEASEFEKQENLYYKIVTLTNGQKEVHIVGHDQSTQHIVIPEKIKAYPVTTIAEYAFETNYSEYWTEDDISAEHNEAYQRSKIKSVTLPNTLKTIEKSAFASNKLTEVTIPNNVVEISANAFAWNKLASVKLSSNLVKIGSGAFISNALTKVDIPNKVKSIGREAFSQNQLTSLHIPNSVTYNLGNIVVGNPLKTVKLPTHLQVKKDKKYGDLFYMIVKINGKNEIKITGYNTKSKATKLTVPATINKIPVREIGAFAFAPHITPTGMDRLNEVNRRLKEVSLPNSIRKIDISAFEGTGIGFDKFPANLVTIGDHAFDYREVYWLNATKNVTLPNKVKTIGLYAFARNNIRGTVTIPATVTSIGEGAFVENKIVKLVIKGNVKEIPAYAFYANKVSDLTLPKTLTAIGPYAFSYNELPRLVVPAYVKEIGREAFSYNKIKSLTLQNNVVTVASWAFFNNMITTVTVPDSVRYFALNAVDNINQAEKNKLKSVTFKGSNTTIDGPLNRNTVYTDKEKTLEFTGWGQVQTKPITLYVN